MRVRTAALLCSVVVWLGLGSSCERGDEFSEAPAARAPEEPLGAGAAARDPGTSGSQARGEVPPGHPPVGGTMEASGGTRAGAGGGREPDSADVPVEWEVPSGWERQPPSSQMRAAEYRIPGPTEAEPATLAVFHFPSGGGSVERNIDRWAGQFETGDGAADPETGERTVRGLTVHTVELSGTYDPGMGMGADGPEPNRKMLGAIVEVGSGSVVFKMVGPRATVRSQSDAFDAFISSLKPGD